MMGLPAEGPADWTATFADPDRMRTAWAHFVEAPVRDGFTRVVPFGEEPARQWKICHGKAMARDAEGRLQVALGACINITDLMAPVMAVRTQLQQQTEALHAANAALVQQTRQLKQANTALEEFAYAASHDLQAPLRAIAHFASWIDEDLPSNCGATVRDHVRGLLGRVNRMVKLHTDLLAYARIAGRQPEIEAVQVGHLVRSTWFHGEPPGGFQMMLSGEDAEVHVAVVSLRTVLRNLFRNVIAHHDCDEGRVLVEMRIEPHQLILRVLDDGPGIPPNLAERIFQVLYQGERSEGSGMGLAIARRHAIEAGGEISCTPREGRGAQFEIRWPLP
jgi:signal transduction histidine kinase